MQRRFFPLRLRSDSPLRRKVDAPFPRMFVVSGCNGSGKTTASYMVLPKELGCRRYVNSDEFAKSLSPFAPHAASITASRYMLEEINYLLEKREDFGVETTLSTKSLQKIISRAKAAGYHTTVLYVWLNSPELAIKRVEKRVRDGGHYIAPETVVRRYYTGLQYFFRYYIPIADKWILVDNTEGDYKNVAQGWKGSMIVHDNKKFEAIRKMAMETTEQ